MVETTTVSVMRAAVSLMRAAVRAAVTATPTTKVGVIEINI